MREIDVLHQGTPRAISCFAIDDVIVDPGPESSHRTLLEALGGEVPRAILLTHIHFDHAGATGALLRRWPDVPVFVHEHGAPHMADPFRLVKSAGRLYGGEEGLRRLWGEVVPVPEGNLRVLTGGERDVEGAFRVEYTPGHASHHVSYFHEPSGWAFVGDTAGVRMPGMELTFAPTPPPDIDIAAWERSLDTIAGWDPAGVAITHFGGFEDVAAQLERCREALHAQADLAGEKDMDGFVGAVEPRVREAAAGLAESLFLAAP